jgi:cell division protein FtsQ
MRSRNKKSKKKKKKAAYRRGEKLTLFFKRGTIALLLIVCAALSVLGAKSLVRQFHIKEIRVSGNYHLDENDIIKSAEITKGQPLLKLGFEEVVQNLKKNAWIKKVALRKQFPDTLLIDIEEAVPKALLSLRKRMYLLDRDGKILERIEGETTPFLPVIKGINTKNKKGISEALKLVHALHAKNTLANRESIVIGLESYGLTMNIDGELIKVGYGNYSKKFDRWIELEPELRKKEMSILYVDLRFKDSVIVKPRETGAKRKSS